MKNIINKLEEPILVIDIHKTIMYAFAEQEEGGNFFLIAFDIKEATKEYPSIYKIENDRYTNCLMVIEEEILNNMNKHIKKIDSKNINVIEFNEGMWLKVTSFENNYTGAELAEKFYLDNIAEDFGMNEICGENKVEFIKEQMFKECDDGSIIIYPPIAETTATFN